MESDFSNKEVNTSDTKEEHEENAAEISNNDVGNTSHDDDDRHHASELQSQDNVEIDPLIHNADEFGPCSSSSREGSAESSVGAVRVGVCVDPSSDGHSTDKLNEEVLGLRRRRLEDSDSRRDSQDEWTPSRDADLRRLRVSEREELRRQEDGERGDEEECPSLTEEEDNFTDYLDSETDYENDHIIQYQAAIVVSSYQLMLS